MNTGQVLAATAISCDTKNCSRNGPERRSTQGDEDETGGKEGSHRIYVSGQTGLRCVSGIHLKKALGGERITLVNPTLESRGFSVRPGFAPAGEALLFRQKAPKPLTPRLVALERTDASLRRADQLAPLKQGPPADKSVPPLDQTAGVEIWETNILVTHMKERGALYYV